ncbi:MAG TPA: response regulator [Candidatus Saccharimonadales bacterium]|jgi:DNA-binding response OmpR family regulator|nr:response regulator [Candidatus Saccharimonadales bacterium]
MSRANILIVEPDIMLGTIYKDFLSKKKFNVEICNDGQKAIDIIDKKTPDLIILELQLAAHNGYEFLYELRSYTEWFSIPVIINSHTPQTKTKLDKDSVKNLGIVGYYYKPITSLEKLYNIIEDSISSTVL